MTKFAIIMTMRTSPMPADRQYEAMKAIRLGMEETGKAIGVEVECKVIPMPDSFNINDITTLMTR